MTTVAAGVLGGALVLTGCSAGGDQGQATPSSTSQHEGHGNSGSSTDSGGMGHPMDGGPAPEGIETAASPTYAAGTEVALNTGHMEGMKGAKATIASSTEETVYMVDDESDCMTDDQSLDRSSRARSSRPPEPVSADAFKVRGEIRPDRRKDRGTTRGGEEQ